MNQMLKDAIREAETLPDDAQEELGRRLMKLAVRKRIDAVLVESEARGGATPHEEVVARIRAQYAG